MNNPISTFLNDVREFLVETITHLDLVDTPVEWVVFVPWRETKALLSSPRRGTATALVLLLTGAPMLRAQTPVGSIVSDPTALAQRSALEGQRTLREKLAQLWNENRDNSKWVTDLVQGYRTIKMGKTMYESIATFDLASNVSIVDVLPEMNLAPGYYFGSQSDGFNSTTTANGKKESYLSLRFRTRNGGAMANITDWAKFKPNLKVDPNKLISQLANLDFDAVKMTQRYNLSGDPIGQAVQNGNPEEAAGKVIAYFDDLLKKANNWAQQRQQEREMTQSLENQLAQDAAIFEDKLQALRDACDAEDKRSKQMFRGLGVQGSLPVSTFETFYAPQIMALREMKETRDEYYRKMIGLSYQDLTDRKTNNEAVQSAVTNTAEMTKLLAENENIRNQAMKAFEAILTRYKVARKDKGEQAGNSFLGLLSLKSDDLLNMKLPPQAESEIQRLQASVANDLQMQNMKMQALKARTENLNLIDREGLELFQQQKDLIDQKKTMAWGAAWVVEGATSKAVQEYEEFSKTLAARRRGEEQALNREFVQNLQAANQQYFTHFSKKGVTSAAKVFDRLLTSFGSVIRAYVGGKTLSDVMGHNVGPVGNVDLAEEWAMYDRAGNGVAS